MHDVGLDAAFVANMSSITFIVLSASKFVTGVMYDKVGLRITLTMCCIAAIICMVSLALTSNTKLSDRLKSESLFFALFYFGLYFISPCRLQQIYIIPLPRRLRRVSALPSG